MQPAVRDEVREPDAPVEVKEGQPEALVTAVRLERAAVILERTLEADTTDPSARAAVARELRMMLVAIDGLPKAKGDVVDELAARRRTRRRTG